jgi:DNA-directed RNA polymerase specialized sigma24 family protein
MVQPQEQLRTPEDPVPLSFEEARREFETFYVEERARVYEFFRNRLRNDALADDKTQDVFYWLFRRYVKNASDQERGKRKWKLTLWAACRNCCSSHWRKKDTRVLSLEAMAEPREEQD